MQFPSLSTPPSQPLQGLHPFHDKILRLLHYVDTQLSLLWQIDILCALYAVLSVYQSGYTDTQIVRCVETTGVFTWENSHLCDFHTRMTSWFFMMFTRWLGHFISCLYDGILHVDNIHMIVIQNHKHYACATHSSLPADWFHTEMSGCFMCTWYCCKILYWGEILAPVQQSGWTHAGVTHTGMTFCGGIM